MDFWGTILVLLRRWYIALPAFVLAFAAAAAMYVSRPIHYAYSSVLVLTAPTSGATQNADPTHPVDLTNPLLNFDQGLNNTAAILVRALSSSEVYDQLGGRPGGDPSFQISNGSSTNPELLIIKGPILTITAESASPGKAQELVVRVVQRARQELADRQKGLKTPPSTYIVLSEIVSPTTPQTRSGTRLRPAAAALAIGFVASLAAAFGAESIMTRPGRRRSAQPAADGRTAAGMVASSGETDAAHTESPLSIAAQLPPGAAALDDEGQG
jgi:hypothetical protein